MPAPRTSRHVTARFLPNSSFRFAAVDSRLRLKPLRNPVKYRQENVEAAGVPSVMQQVVARRGAQPLRQPAAHVHAPVNFFKRDVVNRKADKHSRGPAIAEIPLQKQKRRGVGQEKTDHSPGIPGKVDVPGHFWGVQRSVMHDMLLAKKAAGPVQYESVQAILEPVGVKKTEHEAAQDAGYGMREKPEGDTCKDGPGQSSGQEVVSFDTQPLGFRLSLNDVIGRHTGDTLTLSLICRKRAR